MQRRDFVMLTGAVAAFGSTGCLGGNSSSVPDPETHPSELLPDTDTWELEEQATLAVSPPDIGEQGKWTGPDGERYTMAIVRYEEHEEAVEWVEEYGWSISLAYGVFSFAVRGPDGEHARDLLAASPGLNADIVEEKT